MRPANCLAAIVLLLSQVWGQQPIAFDTVRIGAVTYSIGYSVFPNENGYLVFGLDKAASSPFQDLSVTQFDSEGGIISMDSMPTQNADYLGASSPGVKFAGHIWTGLGKFGALGPLDSLFLYKFDLNGDTIWTKFVDVDTTYTMRGTAVESDGDVLLCGLHYPSYEAYIYHLDSLGNIEGYHGYAGFDGEDVVVGADGSWYVGGRGNTTQYYNRPTLVRSDTNGTQLWRRYLNHKGRYLSLVALADSGVLALGIDGPNLDTGGFAVAVKYDLAGNEVWRREMFQAYDPDWPSNFHAGFENADSTLVIAGTYRTVPEKDNGVIAKLAYNGAVIWQRRYRHYPNADYGKDQIFWDVKPTSDGGLVLTGETNSDNYPYAQLWLLKLDSLGCLVPGCGSVGVAEYTDLFNGKLAIAPNPAREQTHVSLTLPYGFATTGTVQVYLLDAQGRIVLHQPAQENLNVITGALDVSDLASGKYYIHLADSKRWLAGGKLVVE